MRVWHWKLERLIINKKNRGEEVAETTSDKVIYLLGTWPELKKNGCPKLAIVFKASGRAFGQGRTQYIQINTIDMYILIQKR